MPRPRTREPVFGPLDPLLDLFLGYIRVEKNLSPRTVQAYGEDLRFYLDHLHELGLGEADAIEPAHVEAHLARLKDRGLSAKSQARHLAAIRMLHRFLLADRLAKKDPSTAVDRPRPQRKLPVYLNEREVEALLAAPNTAKATGMRDKAILELF